MFFSALLSVIMVGIVSAYVPAFTQGVQAGFPAVTLVAPWVRRVVGRVTTYAGAAPRNNGHYGMRLYHHGPTPEFASAQTASEAPLFVRPVQ